MTVPALTAALIATSASSAMAADPASATTGWRVIKTIAVKNTNLYDIVALPGGTAWAGGQTPAQTPILYHMSGGHWHSVVLPGPADTFVTDLAGTSSGNVWAVIANEPDAARLTSHGWVLKSFADGTDDILMDAVVTFGPANTWVFTYDYTTKLAYANHYNGSSWSTTSLPAIVGADSDAGAVSAISASDIWALAGTPAGTEETLHYNGHDWQVIKFPAHAVPAGQKFLPEQILAESARNVWATVYTYKGSTSGPIVLLHWNGHRWSKVTGKVPAGYLSGPIASDGHGGVWLGAAISNDTPTGKPFILHYRSGTWAKYRSPADSRGPISLYALTLIPGTRSLLGVGDIGEGYFGMTNGVAVVKYGR